MPIKTLNVDVTESRAGEIDPVASENASGAEGSPQSDAEAFLSQALLDPNKIGIAINWDSADQSSDVDLWISDDRYSGELSFQERNKEFGMLHRDVTSVGSLDAAAEEFKSWEWVKSTTANWTARPLVGRIPHQSSRYRESNLYGKENVSRTCLRSIRTEGRCKRTS